MHSKLRELAIFVCLCACVGCQETGYDTYTFSIYGEEFIEDSIPADAFNDGWSLKFDAFEIAVTTVGVDAETDDGDGTKQVDQVFDLTTPTQGEGQVVGMLEQVRDDVEHVRYTVGSVDNAPSIVASGTATLGNVTKTFTWSFDTDTPYTECVVDPAEPQAQLTIHADHLFYDDLESPEPDLRFALIAQADDEGDADGVITAEELAAVDLSALPNYQVGSRPITNLWDFIVAQTTTLGHINGEGHCETP